MTPYEWTSPVLIRIAAEAEPMTPALWEKMKREWEHNAAQGARTAGMGRKRSAAGAGSAGGGYVYLGRG